MSWRSDDVPNFSDQIKSEGHYRNKYEEQTKERQLFLGLLLGIAIGALWEVLRR
jgi:hypothetical protein